VCRGSLSAARRAWGRFVAEQLCLVGSVGRGDDVKIYAGAAYATALTAPIEYLGASVRRGTVGAGVSGDEPRQPGAESSRAGVDHQA
jgi:shikimate kinase